MAKKEFDYLLNDDGTVNVVSLDGQQFGSLPEKDALSAFGEGSYRPMTAAERESALRLQMISDVRTEAGEHPWQAAAERAGSALTFGLTDVLSQPHERVGRAMRAQENPVAAGVGTVGGTLASLALPLGPLGLAGKGGAKLGAAAAERLIPSVAARAAEGIPAAAKAAGTTLGERIAMAEALSGAAGEAGAAARGIGAAANLETAASAVRMSLAKKAVLKATRPERLLQFVGREGAIGAGIGAQSEISRQALAGEDLSASKIAKAAGTGAAVGLPLAAAGAGVAKAVGGLKNLWITKSTGFEPAALNALKTKGAILGQVAKGLEEDLSDLGRRAGMAQQAAMGSAQKAAGTPFTNPAAWAEEWNAFKAAASAETKASQTFKNADNLVRTYENMSGQMNGLREALGKAQTQAQEVASRVESATVDMYVKAGRGLSSKLKSAAGYAGLGYGISAESLVGGFAVWAAGHAAAALAEATTASVLGRSIVYGLGRGFEEAAKAAGRGIKRIAPLVLSQQQADSLAGDVARLDPVQLQQSALEGFMKAGLPAAAAGALAQAEAGQAKLLKDTFKKGMDATQRARAARVLDAVQRPHGIAERVKNLTVTHEDLQWLAASAPKAFAAMQRAAQMRLDSRERISPAQRRVLEMIAGRQAQRTMTIQNHAFSTGGQDKRAAPSKLGTDRAMTATQALQKGPGGE